MRVLRFLVPLFIVLTVPVRAQNPPHDEHLPGAETWFSTFAIVAFDPATSQLGVGVQSRAFAAGAIVPWAKAGGGAIATQAAANRTYGPTAIALLEQGLSPEEVIDRVTVDDELAQAYATANQPTKALASLTQAVAIAPYMKLDALESPAFAKMHDLAEFKRLTAR